MISTREIKELREKTGAGISDIKKALDDSGGDMVEAETLIEKRLGSSAGKRADRETKAGAVEAYVHAGSKIGVLLELQCETDFVARHPDFKALAHDLAMHIAAMDPADNAALLEQVFIRDPAKSVAEMINEHIGRFGENIKIERFIRYQL